MTHLFEPHIQAGHCEAHVMFLAELCEQVEDTMSWKRLAGAPLRISRGSMRSVAEHARSSGFRNAVEANITNLRMQYLCSSWASQSSCSHP